MARTLVFTRTKRGADRVAKRLLKSAVAAEAIHSNKSQNARQRALENFKNGRPASYPHLRFRLRLRRDKLVRGFR
jgi:superfamily II DNA/RNA helicase